MRIALHHDLPPGGALRYVQETTRRSAAQHEYTLFADDPRQVGELAPLVSDVVVMPEPTDRAVGGRVGRLRRDRERQHQLARLVDAGGYDVAVVHPSQTTHGPALLTALTETPSVYIAHEGRRRSYEPGYLPWVESDRRLQRMVRQLGRAPLERVLRRWDATATAAATTVVANSVFTAENLERVYGRTAVVVHPGVDVDQFAPGTGPRSGVISVGALDPTKGHDLVVDALGLLPVAERPALTVVYERCDARFADQLTRRVADRGVDLQLRSRLTESELVAAYAGAVASVAAARLEPFGLTVLESIAAGTPVVAVDEGGFRESVRPGTTGELVARDAGSLAAAIGPVLDHPGATPSELHSSLTPYWTWDRTVDELHAVFASTCRAGR